jgi:hypothetical protein
MVVVGTRCYPACFGLFLLTCYLLLCSCNEQSRLKSPITVQNMPLCSKPPRCGRWPLVLRQPVFFANGGPLLGTLVATTPLSKCFSRCSCLWYMVISSSCWSLPELDTDLQPYFATSIPIDSSAGNSKWYVCDGFASVSRIATSFWYKLDICMLREYEVTTIYLPIYIQ